MANTIRIKVLRQSANSTSSTWDTFEIPFTANMNVISALMEVRKNPKTTDNRDVEPPVWDAACLEEVCGSCTMNINGNIRQACSALIEDVATLDGDTYEVTLEPMKKFPLIRDLSVDRSKMFDNLIKLQAWVPIDGSYDLGMAPAQDDHIRQFRYALSRCMTCGCCMEACPQVHEGSNFIGPSAISQVRLFNLHPSGKMHAAERLEAVMGEGGVADCGKAQNCVEVCPKEIPLVDSIAQVSRQATKQMLFGWLLK